MPAVVLIGAQWGDEGKGKATDLLGGRVPYVVRYQGGNNAGHTVITPDGDRVGRGGVGDVLRSWGPARFQTAEVQTDCGHADTLPPDPPGTAGCR